MLSVVGERFVENFLFLFMMKIISSKGGNILILINSENRDLSHLKGLLNMILNSFHNTQYDLDNVPYYLDTCFISN